MASLIWLTTLLSFAAFIFLAISGRRTAPSVSFGVSVLFYGASFIVSVLTFIGLVMQSGESEEFLFSMGLSIHEGFRVSYFISISVMVIYGLALVLSIVYVRRSYIFAPSKAHFLATQSTIWTFGLTSLIISPTLTQAATGLAVCFAATVWWMLLQSRRGIMRSITASALIVVAFLAQTAVCFVAWHQFNTVQLTQIQYAIASTGNALSPVIWIWFLGMLLHASAFVVLPFDSLTSSKQSATVCSLFTSLASALFLALAWTMLHSAAWTLVVVIIGFVFTVLPLGLMWANVPVVRRASKVSE